MAHTFSLPTFCFIYGATVCISFFKFKGLLIAHNNFIDVSLIDPLGTLGIFYNVYEQIQRVNIRHQLIKANQSIAIGYIYFSQIKGKFC